MVPWEKKEIRKKLSELFDDPLRKAYNGPSVTVFDTANKAKPFIITCDAEPQIRRTHDETGNDFPWQVSTAENCCAAGTTLCFTPSCEKK